MSSTSQKLLRLVLSATAAVMLFLCISTVSFATSTNDKINNAQSGVVKVNVSLYNNGQEYFIQGGSGFLINQNTVLTTYHVTYVDDYVIDMIKSSYSNLRGKTNQQIRAQLVIRVTTCNGGRVTATLNESASNGTADFAVLRLSMPLSYCASLPIRNSRQVNVTESCYALGYDFTDSVTVLSGNIKSLSSNYCGIVQLAMSGAVSNGCSGGPVLDSNGNVIGIIRSYDSNQIYAVASQEFEPALAASGISYTAASTSQVSLTAGPAFTVAKAKAVKIKGAGRKIKVSWKKLTKKQRKTVSKIEVQYSTSKGFDNASTKSKLVKNTKNKITVKKLLKKNTYYVRVRNLRNVNGVYYASPWSKTRRIRTK